MHPISKMFLTVGVVATGAMTLISARADEWPQRNVRIITPSPPGIGGDVAARLYAEKLTVRWSKPVIVEKLGLPSTFTLDACRHGGMTELEEAGLTDGQGSCTVGAQEQQAYEGYDKRTMERAL